MPKRASVEERPNRVRRLSADERRRSILDAARKAFSDTGDMNGTTMRTIADRAGISEGVIYRHFESKDQLFYEAVVEPLREAIDSLVAATEVVDRDGPLSIELQQKSLASLYRQLSATLEEVLPLLGLVLFGDPKVARRFYREHFSVAMDRLSSAWAAVEERYGVEADLSGISARAVMGTAMMLALDHTHARGKAERDVYADAARGTLGGFFPALGDDT
jgi:AcrR family transcriptional regulator